MDWRLLGSTFVLIFLAELGDKTQLAAMMAAGSRPGSTLSVFLGACAALVASTLVAVLIGDALTKVVPQPVINGVAGVLFVIFGAVLLYAAVRPAEAEKEEVPAAAAPVKGFLAGIALEAAADFEAATAADYRQRAAEAEDPALAQLLAALAEEEEAHLRHIHELTEAHGEVAMGREQPPAAPAAAVPAPASPATAQALAEAVAHEEHTVRFYRACAAAAPFASLAAAFQRLASEEEQHVGRLRSWL
jgi:rubrerythrin